MANGRGPVDEVEVEVEVERERERERVPRRVEDEVEKRPRAARDKNE